MRKISLFEQIGAAGIILLCAASAVAAADDGAAQKKTAKPIRIPKTADHAVATNIIAYWKFDEGTGDILKDSTGKYDAALHNADDNSRGRTRSGTAFLLFEGKTYADAPDFPFMETGPGKSMTITGWVKPAGGFILAKNTGNAVTNFEFGISVDTGQLTWHAAGSPAGQTFMRLDDGLWHHFAVVLDDDIGTWFVDGREDSSFRINSSNLDQKVSLLIGACRIEEGNRIGDFYRGGLRDLRIYKGALTTVAIARIAGTEN
jgi:hypothetical protein